MRKDKREKTLVYVGLGGNIGDSVSTLKKAIEKMACFDGLKCSRFYRTTPVSPISQDDYVNAVCCFTTTLSPKKLLNELQKIEKYLGKTPKVKQAPRVIDLDILFYGTQYHKGQDLEIPHPRWSERLFVLVPLSDLTHELYVPDSQGKIEQISLSEMLKIFSNIHSERVQLIQN